MSGLVSPSKMYLLVDIAPNVKWSTETNDFLAEVSRTIKQLGDAYDNLVDAYNQTPGTPDPEIQAAFHSHLLSIASSCQTMHTIAKQKIQVFTG